MCYAHINMIQTNIVLYGTVIPRRTRPVPYRTAPCGTNTVPYRTAPCGTNTVPYRTNTVLWAWLGPVLTGVKNCRIASRRYRRGNFLAFYWLRTVRLFKVDAKCTFRLVLSDNSIAIFWEMLMQFLRNSSVTIHYQYTIILYRYCLVGCLGSAGSIPARGRFRVVVHRSNCDTVPYRYGTVPYYSTDLLWLTP